MRKTWMKIMCLFMVISLCTGCASGEKNDKKKDSLKIGVTVYNQYDTFISSVMEEVLLKAQMKEEELGIKISLDVVNAGGSQWEQNNQVEDFVEEDYDVIFVNLVDRTDPSFIIEEAKNAGIPVLFFNRELVDEDLERWSGLYYVGAVTVEPAIMQGQIVIDAYRQNSQMDKNGDGILQYVMLEGEAGHQDSIVRTEQSVATIEKAGIQLEKLDYGIANWDRSQAQTKMLEIYRKHGDAIELIIANNDDMALGAIDALESLGVQREQWPVIVGIDGTNVGIDAVKNGKMIGTVYNDAKGQAQALIDVACTLFLGKEVEEKYFRLPHNIITSENVEEYQ